MSKNWHNFTDLKFIPDKSSKLKKIFFYTKKEEVRWIYIYIYIYIYKKKLQLE